MGPGNLSAVWVWTANMGRFSPRPIQTSDLLTRAGPNPDLYPWTWGFCRLCQDLSVSIFGSAFRLSLSIVTFWYATLNRKILTLVRHCLCLMYWPPWWSKRTEKGAQLHPENDYQWSVNDWWVCILGNLGGDRLHTVMNKVLATIIRKRGSETLPTPSWKWVSTECQRFLVLHFR